MFGETVACQVPLEYSVVAQKAKDDSLAGKLQKGSGVMVFFQ
jgi:hypothetical protein